MELTYLLVYFLIHNYYLYVTGVYLNDFVKTLQKILIGCKSIVYIH